MNVWSFGKAFTFYCRIRPEKKFRLAFDRRDCMTQLKSTRCNIAALCVSLRRCSPSQYSSGLPLSSYQQPRVKTPTPYWSLTALSILPFVQPIPNVLPHDRTGFRSIICGVSAPQISAKPNSSSIHHRQAANSATMEGPRQNLKILVRLLGLRRRPCGLWIPCGSRNILQRVGDGAISEVFSLLRVGEGGLVVARDFGYDTVQYYTIEVGCPWSWTGPVLPHISPQLTAGLKSR